MQHKDKDLKQKEIVFLACSAIMETDQYGGNVIGHYTNNSKRDEEAW